MNMSNKAELQSDITPGVIESIKKFQNAFETHVSDLSLGYQVYGIFSGKEYDNDLDRMLWEVRDYLADFFTAISNSNVSKALEDEMSTRYYKSFIGIMSRFRAFCDDMYYSEYYRSFIEQGQIDNCFQKQDDLHEVKTRYDRATEALLTSKGIEKGPTTRPTDPK